MAPLEPSIPGSYTLAMATDAEFERAGSFDEALDVLLGRVEALGFDGVDYAYLPSTHAPDGGWVGRTSTNRIPPPAGKKAGRATVATIPITALPGAAICQSTGTTSRRLPG